MRILFVVEDDGSFFGMLVDVWKVRRTYMARSVLSMEVKSGRDWDI